MVMHAVFVEVNIDAASAQGRRSSLQILDAQRLRGLGAVSAVILAPERGCAVGVAVFEDEATARKAASTVRVGGQAGPNPMIRFRTVEVREVLARF
jgi:hypothetical protein